MTTGHKNSIVSPFGTIYYSVTSEGDIGFGNNSSTDYDALPLTINGKRYRNSGTARLIKPNWSQGSRYVQVVHYNGMGADFTANARQKLTDWFTAHWDEMAKPDDILDAKIKAAEYTVISKDAKVRDAQAELVKAQQELADLLAQRS